jgi:hypothetical protein
VTSNGTALAFAKILYLNEAFCPIKSSADNACFMDDFVALNMDTSILPPFVFHGTVNRRDVFFISAGFIFFELGLNRRVCLGKNSGLSTIAINFQETIARHSTGGDFCIRPTGAVQKSILRSTNKTSFYQRSTIHPGFQVPGQAVNFH